MDTVVKRLAALRPTIEEIISRAGTAGLTYGVIHQGQVIYTDNFGYRNVEKKLPVNEDMVFQVDSLTKSMIAAAIGMLVEGKKMDWDTPLRELLPEWQSRTPQYAILRPLLTVWPIARVYK
jgi:CubicO group peptidase (beta-lactamase class C family)